MAKTANRDLDDNGCINPIARRSPGRPSEERRLEHFALHHPLFRNLHFQQYSYSLFSTDNCEEAAGRRGNLIHRKARLLRFARNDTDAVKGDDPLKFRPQRLGAVRRGLTGGVADSNSKNPPPRTLGREPVNFEADKSTLLACGVELDFFYLFC